MGDVDLPEPKVETEEEYEAPKKEDSSIGVHEGALSV